VGVRREWGAGLGPWVLVGKTQDGALGKVISPRLGLEIWIEGPVAGIP